MSVTLETRVGRHRSIESEVGDFWDEGARDWGDWVNRLGAATVPIFERLQRAMPGLGAAMLCTGDGFNVCTVGVEEAQVGRLAALASSLHSVSSATAGVVGAALGGERRLDAVTVAAGSTHTVIISIPTADAGPLLLAVTADRVTLGLLLINARASAVEIDRLVAGL